MTEPSAGQAPSGGATCPWCSAAVPADAEQCPACGARLRERSAAGTSIPGVTAVDPPIPTRLIAARPNRLVRLLAGDLDPLPKAPTPNAAEPLSDDILRTLESADAGAFAPPSDAVRKEMARIELEALLASLPPGAAPVSDASPAADAQPGSDVSPTADAGPGPEGEASA